MTEVRRINSEDGFLNEFIEYRDRVKSLETAPAGKIVVRETLTTADPETGVKTILGLLPDGSYGIQPFVYDITPPPVATAPVVASEPGLFIISWDGQFVNGQAQPRDFECVNIIGHKIVGGATVLSVPVGMSRKPLDITNVSTDVAKAGETWQFSLEAEDYNGNRAEWSARSPATYMIDVISSVDAAWTDLKDEVLLATNTAVSAKSASETAQLAADAAKINADKAVQSASKIYRRSGTDPKGIVTNSARTQSGIVSAPSDGAPGGFALQKTGTANNNVYDMSALQVYNPELLYRVSFRVRVVTDGTVLPKVFYGGILGLKADGTTGVTTTGTSSWSSAHYFAANAAAISAASGWVTYTGYFKGFNSTGNGGVHADPLLPGTMHSDVRKIVPMALLDYSGGDGVWEVGTIELDVITSEAQKALIDAKAAQSRADQAFLNDVATAKIAGDAQTSADGKSTIWYLSSAPAGVGHKIGDTWFDTANSYRVNTWNGSIWQATQDSQLALDTATAKGRTYTQNTVPPVEARLPQNLWIDTTAGVNLAVTKYWDGSAWTPVKDAEINAAEVRAALDAQAKADAAANAAINAQAYTLNPSFDTWTASAPTYYSAWGTGPTKETSIFRRGPFSARFDCVDTTTGRGLGLGSPTFWNGAPNLEYWTVELTFQLVSGTSLAGAGVRLDWSGMTNNQTTLALKDEVPSPVVGKWYTVTKTLRRPTNATGTWTGMSGYLMANFSSTAMGTYTIKDIVFDWLNIRPSTAEEILAYTAPTTAYVDQAEADAVLAASNDATTKANAAQAAAISDTTTRLAGKNKVVWSLSAATGTAYTAGDTWYQRDASGAVIAQWEFTTSWQSRTVSDAVMGNITAAKITYGVMSGERIAANTLTANQIFIGDFENISPELGGTGNWSVGATASIDDATTPFEDTKMVTFSNPAVYTVVTNSLNTKAKVSGGDQLAWQYRYKKNGDAAGSGSVSLRLLFEKADGTLLQRLYLPASSAAASAGTLASGTANVFAGSSTVRLELVVSGGTAGSTTPAYVGDIKIRRMTAGNLIVDGAIDGKTITGATVQTEATASRGIKLTSAELTGYDGSGVKNFSLTSAGALTVKGAIQSGSTIEGASLAAGGGGIETTTTPLRGVKLQNSGITTYDSSGNMTFKVDAATGLVEAPGLKANSIKGDKIEGGSVTADKLLIGFGNNLAYNGSAEIAASTKGYTGFTRTTTDVPAGFGAAWQSPPTQTTINILTEPAVPVRPQTRYKLNVWVKADKAGSVTYLEPMTGSVAGGNRTNPIYAFSGAAVPTVWTPWSVEFTTGLSTANTLYFRWFLNHTSGTVFDSVLSFTGFTLTEMNAGELIVDGSITTSHMTSGTIDAGVLSAGSITAPKIAGKTITTDKLVITSTDNLIVGADFDLDAASWQKATAFITAQPTAGRGAGPALRVTGTVAQQTSLNLVNRVTVEPDNRFRCSVFVKSTAALAIDRVRLNIRCYTTATAYSDVIGVYNTEALVANTWTQVEGISAPLPAGTIAVVFYLAVTNNATGTVTDIDYVSATRAADGNLVVDGAIDGKTITGATIRTAASGARIVLDQASLNAWNTAGDNYFNMSNATGVNISSIGQGGFDVTRRNFCTNPSFEVSTSGWTSTQTIIRDTTQAYVGAASIKATHTTTADRIITRKQPVPSMVSGDYTTSAYVRHNAATAKNMRIFFYWTDINNVPLTTGGTFGGTIVSVPANTWTRVTVTTQGGQPGGASNLKIDVAGIGFTSAETMWVDAVLLDNVYSTVNPYFDGTSAEVGKVSYVWEGSTGLSVSDMRTARDVKIKSGGNDVLVPGGPLVSKQAVGVGFIPPTPYLQTAGLFSDGQVVSLIEGASDPQLTRIDVGNSRIDTWSYSETTIQARGRIYAGSTNGSVDLWGGSGVSINGTGMVSKHVELTTGSGFSVAGGNTAWDIGTLFVDTAGSTSNYASVAAPGPLSGTVKVLEAGYYQFSSHGVPRSGAGRSRILCYIASGTQNGKILSQQGTDGYYWEMSITTPVVYLDANDYVRFQMNAATQAVWDTRVWVHKLTF